MTTSDKSLTNRKWVSNEAFRNGWDRTFRQEKEETFVSTSEAHDGISGPWNDFGLLDAEEGGVDEGD